MARQVNDMLTLARAFWHWLRLGYYTAALDHVGIDHADAAELHLRAAESQRVVDDFLTAREAA